MNRIPTWIWCLLFCGLASPVFAERIGDVVETHMWEQAVRFFTFRDPALRYALAGAILLGISCGVLGSFIVVRKMALMGDTLSHAVLPGVAAGFLWSGTKDPLAILIGATAAGLLGTFMVSIIRQTTRIKEDACMGLVLGSFFAVGICMLTLIQQMETGNQSGIDKFMFGQAAALNADDIRLMAICTVVVLIIVTLCYKGFLAASFDVGFAASLGLPVRMLHYLLMGLLAFCIVISLQAVGVVLVSAMLITPAATAYLLTDRMHRMLLYAAGFGMLSGALGAFLSFQGNNLPTGPFMVVGASSFFLIAFLIAPRHGVLVRWFRHKRRSQRIHFENTLKAMHRVLEDRGFIGDGVSLRELAELRRETIEEIRKRVRALARAGQAILGEDGNMVYFTRESENTAKRIVRNHRLWELYLTNEANYDADHVHDDAEKIEHILGEEIVRQLERKLNYPVADPHGKPIPGIQDLQEDRMRPTANTGLGYGEQ
ncbi:MAG: ABC-type Mn2+/Zn2+ transport system permease subunit [Verrucomicrobiales bacterium]|jgi:ABC-type Mn2+/Zn2+ transport system permease subunit/Mn-dependent DtxR family transcriptional regulator